VSGQLHAPGHFTPGERVTGIHWIGGRLDPRFSVNDADKRPSWDSNSDPLGRLARRYTDCATPVPVTIGERLKNTTTQLMTAYASAEYHKDHSIYNKPKDEFSVPQ
jgi:hypothetical protein